MLSSPSSSLSVCLVAPGVATNAYWRSSRIQCRVQEVRSRSSLPIELTSDITDKPLKGSIVIQAAELLDYQPYRLVLACVLEQQQGSNQQIKGKGRGGTTPGGPIVSTNDKQLQQEIKIVGVSPLYANSQPKQRWPIYLGMSFFLMSAAGEWVLAFLPPKFWFFEMFALFGTVFVMTTWLVPFLLFRRLNDSDNGVKVVLENGRNYYLSGGHFMNGIFGVRVSSN